MIRRMISALMVAALAVALWHVAAVTYDPLYGAKVEEEITYSEVAADEDLNTLTLWYTDEALTDYLNYVALAFKQEQGIKVNLVLKSGVEFLEDISNVSVTDEGMRKEAMPDLYITSHDNLLKAYLAGISTVVTDPMNIMNSGHFSDTALNAVTCYGNYVAYPLYYETSYFLYNKTYMASIAQNKIEADQDLKDGQEATALIESGAIDPTKEETDELESNNDADAEGDEDGVNADGNESAEGEEELNDPMGDEDATVSVEVLEKLATMIPSTMDDITTFANNYDAPEQVESVFKWDVTDIFYNYFFVGKYMDVGGEDGDNAAVFNIYNQQAVSCLASYQGMNQFFTMDDEDTYDNILQDFIDGKLVFTVATTDAIAKIQEAKEAGNFDFEYGVTTLPDVSNLLKSRGLSVTDAAAINGYSQKQAEANALATYLVELRADELYAKSGKIACDKNITYKDSEILNIMTEYEKSMPLPKMVEAANYWVQLEIAFTKVWNGADPDETLRELSDTIGAQIEEIRANLPTQESFLAGAGKLIQ